MGRGVRAAGAALRRHRSRASGVSRQRRARPHPERRRPGAALRRSAERCCASSRRTSSARRWAAGSPPSSPALYPERVGSLVLVGAAGLWIEGAPIAEVFGVLPGQLAERLFYDQQHPVAQMLHAAGETAFDTPPPEEILLAFHQSTEATARVAWNPYFHNPALERRLDRIAAPDAGSVGRRGPAHPARPRRALPRPHRAAPSCAPSPSAATCRRSRSRSSSPAK